MLLEYFAHSCFRLSASGGPRLMVDPYEQSVGYVPPHRPAEVTLVSHDHFDHNHVAAVEGRTTVVRGAASRTVAGIPVRGVLAEHGAGQGTVTCFCWEMDGLKICHLSDLGCLLTPDQLEAIGPVDLLFVPCGGGYTLGPAEALETVKAISPGWAVPMHYATPFVNRELFPDLSGVEAMLDGRLPATRLRRSDIELTLDERPGAPEILVLAHLM